MKPYLYLKRQREVRKFKNLKVFIDEFDLIGDYVEIEYQDCPDVKKELEFNFNLNNERLKNFFNGFIDLLFKHNGCYSILDWKSDKLNDDFISYCDNKEMKKHVDDTYSIQRVLYSYCLIKWLKCYYSDLSEEEIFNSYFGGIYYVFLRGCKKETGNGIYSQTWDSFDDLNNEFQNIMNHRIWRKSNE